MPMSIQIPSIKLNDQQIDIDGSDEVGTSGLVSRGFSRDQAIRMISSSNYNNVNVKQTMRQPQVEL